MLSRRDECRQKRQAVVDYLGRHDLDAVVLTRRCNFAWFTAGGCNHVSTAADVGAASLVITRERMVCVANNIEAPRLAEEELADLGVEVRSAAWHDASTMQRLWGEVLNGGRAACDTWVSAMPPSVVDLDPTFAQLRRVMTDGEIERYRRLADEVADGLETACQRARPGMSEFELAAQLASLLNELGIRAPVVLVAADDRVAKYRHPIPTRRWFDRYGMVVAGGERHGLTVSCTRLFSFGPIDDDLRRRHEAVCQVDAEMIAATRPGATLGDVIEVARRAYAEVGFPDEWTKHHQGGLTGYLGRELKAVPGDPTPIQARQVFAWNPSIAGTKSEDTILVAADGNEILSLTGEWPTSRYEAGGRNWCRCEVLEL